MTSRTGVHPFFVADLTAQGELRAISEYDYESLERIPGAAMLIARCSAEIWKTPEEAEVRLEEKYGTTVRWKATADSSGVATIRSADGNLISLSLLASGKNPDADAITLDALQRHLVRELQQTEFEPAFDLMEVRQRPLLATITFSQRSTGDGMVEALADRTFAAALFRYLGLV